MLQANNIYLGNSMKLMNDIKTGSIDLILCDLPYGSTQNEWDRPINFIELWKHYERIIKDNGAIVLFAQSPFDKKLAMSNIDLFRYEWIWEKPAATGFLNASKMPLKAHENILVFYKKLPVYNPIKTTGHKKEVKKASADKCIKSENYGKNYHRTDYCSTERYPRSVLRYSTDKQKGQLHPTQKPLELIKYLINTYTNPNDIVLDNCMGSGTTPVAAIQTNRRYIGIEIMDNYYNIAKERIDQAKGNVGLFANNPIYNTTSKLTSF